MFLIWIFTYGNNQKARFSFSYCSLAIRNLSQMSVMREFLWGGSALSRGNVIPGFRRGNEWQLIKYCHQPPHHGKCFLTGFGAVLPWLA